MSFQPHPDSVVWRLHLHAAPERVFDAIDGDADRASFWAESAVERDGAVEFRFINGMRWSGRIVARDRPREWALDYFGNVARFELEPDGAGGTDLTLTHEHVRAEDRNELTAGWLNVLLPLKAWVDHGVDLRNHDPDRTWDQAYVDQ